jgi:two-component system phosphate regulon sensor histidine kinase PhoR
VETLGECLKRRTAIRREILQTTHSGERILEIHASPLPGEKERSGAVLVLHEITELRRLEAVRRDFVANVSHELKTPLTAIRGLVDTVKDDPSMDHEMRQRFLGRLGTQATRLAALIGDLLSISRLESGERPSEQERIDLREVAQTAISGMAAQAESAGLTPRSEMPDTPLPVLGDRLVLEQAVGNLLDNALKYTPAGGEVRIRTRQEGNHVVVEVEDTGIGIEPRHQERIFERFYRIDKARSRDLGGTGLGLSIVKHVVLSHRGSVEVESEPGHGSIFRIRLPLAH